ncbi:MAG: hypothetical protein QM820_41125 [Minicystis sp.]
MDPVDLSGPEHTVTLHLPDVLYERVQHAAETLKRSVEDIVLNALATALPPLTDLPGEIADDVSALAFLNDTALFEVARSAPAPELSAEMDALLADKGRGALDAIGQQRLDDLVRAHEISMLRRAQAALLLQRRGYNMSDPAVSIRLP